jgi:hypothetical protein
MPICLVHGGNLEQNWRKRKVSSQRRGSLTSRVAYLIKPTERGKWRQKLCKMMLVSNENYVYEK